jgi:Na+-driven multidrug efflux pump
MEIGCGILRGIGKAILPMVVSLLGSCAFRIVWIMTVFAQIRTLECLFISYPISWLATGAVHFLCVFFALRKLKRAQDAAKKEITVDA